MENKYIDLHIHSFYSDGTMSAEEIIEEAIKAGVYTIAITDHNIIEGCNELIECAKGKNIECITGVELDAVTDGINYHILAYGVDLDNKKFIDKVKKNQKLLEEVNKNLILKMEKEMPQISYGEYSRFTYDKTLGGWKALHYFLHKGISDSLFGGYALYEKFNHSYACVNFPNIDEVCCWIHEAGGKAILAHPGRVIRESNHNYFYDKVNRLIDLGLDGIECYYPSHSKELTDICLTICKERNLIVTSGSDCHGDFEDTLIGQMETLSNQVTVERLREATPKIRKR